MAFHLIAEAVLRMEHKLDILLERMFAGPHPAMQFATTSCPVCKQQVVYQLDMEHQIAIRRCGCKTGLVPTQFKIVPPPMPGVPLARTDRSQSPSGTDEPGAENGPGRKGR